MTAYDHYWTFAAERQNIFWHRYHGKPYATKDEALQQHKFTNCYRAIDRVSQYVINTVQRGSVTRDHAIFRTLLFKQFNKIETWEALEHRLGYLHGAEQLYAVEQELTSMKNAGEIIYSNAYMMKAPTDGRWKHQLNLECVAAFERQYHGRDFQSLEEIFWACKSIPNWGNFLAYQYAIDLNYIIGFPESTFVVPGPGCIEGVKKCHGAGADPLYWIYRSAETQTEQFNRLGLTFRWLPNRALQWIDCQNLYCEIGKYLRWAMPSLNTGRTRIKARYNPHPSGMYEVRLPDHWKVDLTRF